MSSCIFNFSSVNFLNLTPMGFCWQAILFRWSRKTCSFLRCGSQFSPGTNRNQELKGVWHEIFDFRFFSWFSVLQAPKYSIQGCESRRQKNSTCSWPRFREIWKVSSLSRSLPLSGKKVAAAAPAIWFSETPPRRERELDRCSSFATPPPPCSVFSARIYRKN